MFLETVGPVSSPRPDAASPSCIGGENASPANGTPIGICFFQTPLLSMWRMSYIRCVSRHSLRGVVLCNWGLRIA
jgi:hypothetical protein